MAKKGKNKRKTTKPKKVKPKNGQKLDKGESLYNAKLLARIKEIIFLVQPLKTNSSLHYAKIAKIIGIAQRTFNNWRDPLSQYYKPDLVKTLAAAHQELTEKLDSGKIKRAMIERAQPYTRIKKTKELQVSGPRMPPMGSMDKKALQFTAKNLGLKIDKKDTCGVLKIKIAEEVDRQTKEVMVVVKQEEERIHGDVGAAKLVLPNIGPPEERWQDKSEVEVVGKSLADIAALMSGKKN